MPDDRKFSATQPSASNDPLPDHEAVQSYLDSHSRYPRSDLGRDLEKAVDQKVANPAESARESSASTTPSMSVKDRRFWLAILWAGSIGGALAVGCYIAWASGQMPWQAAVPGIAVGLLVMGAASIYALEKRPPVAWQPGKVLVGTLVVTTALTWVVVGWQTWMWFHPSVEGYTQAQLDAAISKAKVASPFGPTLTEPGPIGWVLDSQFLVTSYTEKGDAINSVILQGKSRTSIGFKTAEAISGLTGHHQTLYADVPNKGGFLVNKVDIPPLADVQLEMTWSPPLSVQDFLDQWGKFRVVITYDDGTTWDHEFDEAYVRDRLNRQIPSAFGPRVTVKDGK